MPKPKQICSIHNIPLKYSQKHRTHYCKECLYASFLTHQAQQDAVKRYRQSEKGKAAEERYEKSPKGKAARERYLKSEKYKQRRREYNERLKESLQIARLALAETATRITKAEEVAADELASLIQDIREYIDVFGVSPSHSEVIKWARDTYSIDLPHDRAIELLNKARLRRG